MEERKGERKTKKVGRRLRDGWTERLLKKIIMKNNGGRNTNQTHDKRCLQRIPLQKINK